MSKHRPLLHKAHNKMRYGWHDFVRIRGSIIPYVFLPTMVLTLWSIAWLLLNKSAGWTWFLVSNQLVTILGVVMSLLLVFRTNTAYDRYWEGRRTWSTLLTQVRNMARLTWLGVQSNGEHDVFEQKKGCLSLLLAFVVATKHYLRNEEGHNWDDLRHLLQHLPDFRSTIEGPHVENLPVEVSLHLTSYINRVKDDGLIEAGPFLAMTNAVNAMVDCLSSFERIRNSPIPMAYHVHLRQSLWLYLISLPFQTIQTIGWGTVPVVMLASFTMLGIDSIGRQIEDPFGYDENDLPVDDFCEETERELGRLMGMSEGLTPERWGFAREMVRVDPKQDGALVIEVGLVGGKEL
ncbi:hypothetical protein HK097_003986 [Rhizophlyctis rosea]|uniref:Bestrophin homolog n=1 Tax=Rhizophlyctis rosea TaxID=64517 RepID=A0AAD5X627_9FUNG|nr:hypothetical protein HK097_003986 [Rhizophlyctis rosea]